MKSNLKFDTKNLIAEVSISNIMEEDETEMHNEYMSECMLKDESLINTAGMSTSDAKYMCGMSYMKNRPMLTEMAGQLTEKQKTLPPALQKAILKNMHKKGKLNEEGKKEAGESPEAEKSEAAQIAVFPETPAAPSGNITPDAAIEGLSIDEKLKIQQEKSAPKNPGLQSAGFDPKA
jgi:sRNA-binding protein